MGISKYFHRLIDFLISNKLAIIFGLIILSLSEISVRFFFPISNFISSPLMILSSYRDAISEGLFGQIVITTLRTLFGFSIALILGILLGVIIGRSKLLTQMLYPYIDLLRPLPSSAIIPWASMFIGLNESTNIFIIVFGGLWPILISTISGVAFVDQSARDSIEQLPLTRYQKLKWFILPEAASEIFTGLKISLSVCLILAVTVELIGGGGDQGIGRFLVELENGGNYTLMYFSIISIAILGYLLNSSFRMIEKFHPWLKYKYYNNVDK